MLTPRFLGLETLIITSIIAISPPLAITFWFNSPSEWLLFGAVAWSIALGMKLAVGKIIYYFFSRHERILLFACGLGIMSSITELGVTAFFFVLLLDQSSIIRVVTFGIGVSTTEIIFVIVSAMIEHRYNRDQGTELAWTKGASKSLVVRYMSVVERVDGLIGHISSRGLIYLSILWNSPAIAILSIFTFSIVDGVATYGSLAQWNWFDPHLCRRFYLFVTGVSVIEMLVFLTLVFAYL
jgi:hypothetical protein